MLTADTSTAVGLLGLIEAAEILGLTPRQVKQAVSAGVLPPPTTEAISFALAAFDASWISAAKAALAADPKRVRGAPYTPRPIERTRPVPGVREVDPARIRPPDPSRGPEEVDGNDVK